MTARLNRHLAAAALAAALGLAGATRAAEPATKRTAPEGRHLANLIGSCSLDRTACVDYEGSLGLDPKERCEEGKRLWRDTACPTLRLVATCTRVEAAGFSHTRSYQPVTLEVARAACQAGGGNFQPKRP